MRTAKGFLIFLSVVVAGMLGLMLPPLAADFIHQLLGGDSLFALAAFCGCLALTVAGFAYYLRKTRAWEFELDVADCAFEQSERRLHPGRAKYGRILRQSLVWAPSLIAAFVLVYFPEISHVPHLGSRYLKHYRIPIPLNIAVLSFSREGPSRYDGVEAQVRNTSRRRHGGLYFWERDVTSVLTFGNQDNEQAVRQGYPSCGSPATRELRLGDLTLTCWKYPTGYGPGWTGLSCRTCEDIREFNFSADFAGLEADLPIFYSILNGVERLP